MNEAVYLLCRKLRDVESPEAALTLDECDLLSFGRKDCLSGARGF